MDTQRIYSWFRAFRRKRMDVFINEFRPTAQTTILDVGGFSGFWADSGVSSSITILRPEGPEDLPVGTPPNIRSIGGDGRDLRDHGDQSYDLVFSNSVIEHVGDEGQQRAFAGESLRVGRSVWVQTPAWEFPIEPHVLTPFIHWLPQPLQEKLLPWTVWALLRTPAERAQWVQHVRARLLSRREMERWFPGTRILTERFCGWPKSYTAFHHRQANGSAPTAS